jgi:hypothetical protein
MPSNIEIGSILIKGRPPLAGRLGLESDAYSQNWSVVRALNGFSLDRKIRAAGWNSFFMAGEVQARAFGSIKPGSLLAALQRIFAKVRHEDFNCMEVTGIAAGSFLGLPYVTISAHSRHIQKGFQLDHSRERRAAQGTVGWAKG